MPTRQQRSNYKEFSVTLTDSTNGGTAVGAAASAKFYLWDDTGAILDAVSATPTVSGSNLVVTYQTTPADLDGRTRVYWQFAVFWDSPTREWWSPVETLRLDENL